MSKIMRQTAEIFASQASTAQIAQFGSLAANAPMVYSGLTATPAGIQALANWLQGWFSGVEGAASPAIEDLNGYCFVMAYQIAYCLQTGVAEWDSGTTYFIGSVVNDGHGNLYVSLTDNNLNNALTNTSNWRGPLLVNGSNASPNVAGGTTAVPVTANVSAQDIYVIGNSFGWQNEAAASATSWSSVVWSPELGLFCAVSLAAGTSNIMTSPDGVTWTTRTGPTLQPYQSVCWSSYLGLFCAVPSAGGATTIATSPDGITWTGQTNPGTTLAWTRVVWADSLKLFVAVSATSSTSGVMHSSDGVNWTQLSGTLPTSQSWRALAWSPDLGMFVALGLGPVFMYSKDGTNWLSSSQTQAIGLDLAWSSAQGIFVASTNGVTVNYSYDGLIWANKALGTSGGAAPGTISICWSSSLGLFVTSGTPVSGNNSSASPDGLNWTNYPGPSGSNLDIYNGICFSPARNQFIAVSTASTNRVMSYTINPVTANPGIIAGSTQSQRITLIGSDDLNSVILSNGNGLALTTPTKVLKKNITLKFLWDAAQSLWIQA